MHAAGLARRLAEAEAAGQGMRARVAALTRLNSDLSRGLAAREAGSGAVAALQVRHWAAPAAVCGLVLGRVVAACIADSGKLAKSPSGLHAIDQCSCMDDFCFLFRSELAACEGTAVMAVLGIERSMHVVMCLIKFVALHSLAWVVWRCTRRATLSWRVSWRSSRGRSAAWRSALSCQMPWTALRHTYGCLGSTCSCLAHRATRQE